jgi:hypothetical protein
MSCSLIFARTGFSPKGQVEGDGQPCGRKIMDPWTTLDNDIRDVDRRRRCPKPYQRILPRIDQISVSLNIDMPRVPLSPRDAKVSLALKRRTHSDSVCRAKAQEKLVGLSRQAEIRTLVLSTSQFMCHMPSAVWFQPWPFPTTRCHPEVLQSPKSVLRTATARPGAIAPEVLASVAKIRISDIVNFSHPSIAPLVDISDDAAAAGPCSSSTGCHWP